MKPSDKIQGIWHFCSLLVNGTPFTEAIGFEMAEIAKQRAQDCSNQPGSQSKHTQCIHSTMKKGAKGQRAHFSMIEGRTLDFWRAQVSRKVAPCFFSPIMGCGASSEGLRTQGRNSHESHSIGQKQFMDIRNSTKAASADRDDVSLALYTNSTRSQCNNGDVQLREVTSVRDFSQGDAPSEGLSNMHSLKLGLKMLPHFSFSVSKKAKDLLQQHTVFTAKLIDLSNHNGYQ